MERTSSQHWAMLKNKKNNTNNNMRTMVNKNINLPTTTKRSNRMMELTKMGK